MSTLSVEAFFIDMSSPKDSCSYPYVRMYVFVDSAFSLYAEVFSKNKLCPLKTEELPLRQKSPVMSGC